MKIRKKKEKAISAGIGLITRYISLAIFAACILIPFYWMLKSSLSTPEELTKLPPAYFPEPTLQNFKTLMEQVPFADYIFNSLVFSTLTTILTVGLSFFAAYAFARIPFPGSAILMWGLVLSMSLPEVATLIPLYRLLRVLHLLDSLPGLTMVMSSTLAPFTVWIMVPFIKNIPYEVEEAAIIDGARLGTIFWRIYLPLTAPALVTMLVINFINAWNNLLYPLAFSVTTSSKTLSVAITEIFQAQVPWGKPWHLVSSLGVTMLIPVIILVLFSQKAIVRGLTRGAIK
jgi:ABC-type glycerol-3-phosphate transport system permease component